MAREWRTDTSTRRLGERRSLPEQTAAFVLRPRQSLFRRSPVRVAVHVDNVSVTGVGFFAPTTEKFVLHDQLSFEIEAIASPIRLRRVTESVGSGWTYCGAEFLEPTPGVMPAIDRLLSGGQTSGKDMRWQQGTIR